MSYIFMMRALYYMYFIPEQKCGTDNYIFKLHQSYEEPSCIHPTVNRWPI